jgi:hypothetical protein
VLDVERMLSIPPPPVPWIVRSLLVAGCVTMLAGREGQGKSMLALGLAAALGHGEAIAGMECLPGTVLYVDAENGEREAHRRVHGVGIVPGTLVYVEAQRFNLADDASQLGRLVDEHEPSVVMLDSLRSLAPGLDENDSRAAEAALRPVSRLAQQRNVPVLLLHHAGKSGLEYRGSTAIGAAVALGFTLSRHDEDPDKATRRKLTCWKCRPDREPPPRSLSLDADSDGVSITEADPFVPERDAPTRDIIASQVRAFIEGCHGATTPRGAGNAATPSWTTAELARAVGRSKNDGTVRRAVQRLGELGVLYRNGDGRWHPSPTLLDDEEE